MSDDTGFKPPKDPSPDDREPEESEGIRLVGPSEPLPHWTEPATGEMPRLLFDEEPEQPDEDLEAWSSFAATPRWRSSADDWDDDTDISEFGDSETRIGALDSGADQSASVFVFDDTTEPPTDPAPAVTPIRTGSRSAPVPAPPPAAAAAAARSTTARKQPSPPRPGSGGPAAPSGDRDLPVAIGVGVALAVVALVLFSIGPGAAMGLVTLVIAAAAARVLRRDAEGGVPPGDASRHRRVRRPAPRDLLAGRGRDPTRARAERRVRPALVPLRRGRRQAGAEPRGHAARRRLRRIARGVRRAHPPVPERSGHVARRDHRDRRLRRRWALRRVERGSLAPRAEREPEQDLRGPGRRDAHGDPRRGGHLRPVRAVGRPRRLDQARRRRRRSPLRSATSASR